MQAIALSAGIIILAAKCISAQEASDQVKKEQGGKTDQADQPEESQRRSGLVSIELRMIEMPRLAADEVFREQGGIAKTYVINEKTLGVISAMVTGNKAKVVGQLQVVAKSGQNSEIKSVQEIAYPTRFDMRACVDIPSSETNSAVGTKGTDMPAANPVPGFIEQREIGTILSVSPVIDPSRTLIDLTLIPQRVRMSEYPCKPTIVSAGCGAICAQPLFITESFATSISAPTGKPLLLGVCDVTDDQEKSEKIGENIILWIVTATIVNLAP